MVNDNNPPLASTTSDSGTLLVYPLGRKWLYATFRVKYLKSGSEQLYTNKFDSCKKLENSSIHVLCGDWIPTEQKSGAN